MSQAQEMIYKDIEFALQSWTGGDLTVEQLADLVDATLKRNWAPGELRVPLAKLVEEGKINQANQKYRWNR